MSNAVTGYPRWEGQLSRMPPLWSIAVQEVRRAYNDQWVRAALILAFGWAVISIMPYFNGPARLSVAAFELFLGFIRWAALGVAAIMAGTALLDDHKKGALELYLSRSVTPWSYLAGKVVAVFGLTFLTIFGPALIFYGASFLGIEERPEGWAWVILGAAGYAAIRALVVTGLGLGVSNLVRSSRSASILLFAGVASLDIILGSILGAITDTDLLRVVSPMTSLEQQSTWLFGSEAPFAFPWWWGLIALGIYAAIGWMLVYTRRPRVRGVE